MRTREGMLWQEEGGGASKNIRFYSTARRGATRFSMGTNTGTKQGVEWKERHFHLKKKGRQAEGCVVSGPRGSRPPFILVRNKKTKILWSSSTEGAGEKKKKRVRRRRE
jgi:hypothetical protein